MKIHNKLFLILFSFSLLLVTGLVLLVQWSIGRGMVEYVNSKEMESLKPITVELASEYKKQNNWSILQGKHRYFEKLILINLKNNGFTPPPPPPRFPPELRKPPLEFERSLELEMRTHPQAVIAGYALLDDDENVVAGYYRKDVQYSKVAITVSQEDVGWLVVPIRHQLTEGYELDFIEQQQSYLWIIALATMLLVALITFPLARHLVEPIKLIMFGVHKLTQGNYKQRITLHRKDELGELSRDFNELAITLYENEKARKRWLANISHELRTPVAILRGELEAMLDNVRPLSKSNINSANDEVKQLQSLIDDLHQLTSADIGGMNYHKSDENVGLWLNTEVKKYHGYLADAGIVLGAEIGDMQIHAFVDTTRLCQLFDNLINNCIKYSQANLVKISLQVDQTSSNPLLRIKVEDDGIGVAEEHLPHLFEHLYRVENSRNRETGGSGLGLSICAHITNVHQGNIYAEPSNLGGLAIVVELPLNK